MEAQGPGLGVSVCPVTRVPTSGSSLPGRALLLCSGSPGVFHKIAGGGAEEAVSNETVERHEACHFNTSFK